MKRTGMMRIRDILRHRFGFGLTRARIAVAVGVSTGTVSHVLDRASAAGLSWPLPGNLDDEAMRARLYPASGRDGRWHVPGAKATESPPEPAVGAPALDSTRGLPRSSVGSRPLRSARDCQSGQVKCEHGTMRCALSICRILPRERRQLSQAS